MNKYIEVMQRILGLAETMEGAILYMDSQIKEARFEQALVTLEDIMDAQVCIREAMVPIQAKLENNGIEDSSQELQRALGETIELFERGDASKIELAVESNLVAAFTRWQGELRRVLEPYVLC